MLSILPRDLIDTVLNFIIDDDNEYGVVRQVSKHLDIVSKDFELSSKRFVIRVPRIKWARDNNCSFSETTCAYAARIGQLEVLQWLRNTAGCPWDIWTVIYADRNNHLRVLWWAKANGCPWMMDDDDSLF